MTQEHDGPDRRSPFLIELGTVERAGPAGFVFLLAYIGAAIYFISNSDGSFWGVILGLLQAIVWPVYVVYHVLGVLGA